MKPEDKLIVSQLKEQNNAMIQKLKESNAELSKSKFYINQFNHRDGIQLKGHSYEEGKKQMADYLYIIQAITIVNNYHIDEYNKLNDMVGDEDLIGSVILDYLSQLDSEYADLKEQKDEIARQMRIDHFTHPDNLEVLKNQLSSVTYSMENNRATYKVWKGKEEFFDNVSLNTSQMFESINQQRKLLKNAMNLIDKQFTGGTYHCLFTRDLKDNIEAALVKYKGKGRVELKNPLFTCTDKHGNRFYGGNQSWSFDYSGPGNDILVLGCSLIALVNVMYYLEGTTEITVKDFKNRVWEYLNANQPMFSRYVAECEALIPCEEGNENDVQTYLDRIVKEHGYKGATWTDLNIDVIKDQLAHDIPVVYCINGKDKDDKNLYLYKRTGEYEYKKVEYTVADEYVSDTGWNKELWCRFAATYSCYNWCGGKS